LAHLRLRRADRCALAEILEIQMTAPIYTQRLFYLLVIGLPLVVVIAMLGLRG